MTDPTLPTTHERHGEPEARARNRGRDTRLVVTGIAAVLLVWFAVANLQQVQIHFWLSSAKAPVIAVILISGVLGSALTALGSRMARRRRRAGEVE